MMKRMQVLLTIFLVLAMTNIARADDAAAAEATFQRGKKHMDAGRYAEACADFELSERIDSSVGTLLNLGECNSKLGKTATAWAAFKKAGTMAKQEGQTRRFDYAQERANKLEARLTRLDIQIDGEQASGLTLTRDGQDITLLIGTVVPVDPGKSVFEATAPGREAFRLTLEVAGEGETVVLEIPELQEPNKRRTKRKGSADLISTTESEREPRSKRRVIAMGVGGVGVAAAATGLVFGGLARSKLRESKGHCTSDNLCDQTGFDLVEDAKSQANISTALVGLGGLAMLAGGVLWLTAPAESSAEARASLRVTPYTGDSQIGVALSGGF